MKVDLAAHHHPQQASAILQNFDSIWCQSPILARKNENHIM